MIGYRCVIYWENDLRLRPLVLQGANSENNTKKKYFRTREQSDRTLTRGYIAKTSSQSSGAIEKDGD